MLILGDSISWGQGLKTKNKAGSRNPTSPQEQIVILSRIAKNLVIAGYAVETPRLLLNSASSMFPNGLSNSSGMVGKCFMVHTGEQAFARFPQRINQYKAPPPRRRNHGAVQRHYA
jgi:hypothetical protein